MTNPCPQNREASISDSLMNVLRAVLRCFSRVRLFVTLWTVGGQVPLSMGILQARILEWVAMPASRASTQGSNPRLLCLLHWQVFFVVVVFFLLLARPGKHHRQFLKLIFFTMMVIA